MLSFIVAQRWRVTLDGSDTGGKLNELQKLRQGMGQTRRDSKNMRTDSGDDKFPNASAAFRRRNPHLFGAVPAAGAERIRADVPQPRPRRPLVSDATREAGSPEASAQCDQPCRFRVRFTVYACRPCDWDNYRTKPLQDCLVAAGFMPDDNWKILEGEVVSMKARSKAEQRTVIELWRIET